MTIASSLRNFRPSATALVRRVIVEASAHYRKEPQYKVARSRWPDDRTIVRAPSDPPLGVPEADGIARQALVDFLAALTPVSSGARVLSEGLQLAFDRAGEISVPGFAGWPAGFVGERAPIPVSELVASAAVLRPCKIDALCMLTREMVESSNAEAIVGNQLMLAVRFALERALFDDAPGDSIRPPGLRSYSLPLTPSTATENFTAMTLDMRSLINATQAYAGASPFVFIGRTDRAIDMVMRMPTPPPQIVVLPTAGLPGNVLLCVAPEALVSAVGPPTISIAREATLHADTDPQALLAVPTRSLFQTDTIALKVEMMLGWALRHPNAAAWLQPSWPTDTGGGGGGGQGIPDAPQDNTLYGRRDASWQHAVGEAPEDGELYARRDASWETVAGSIPEPATPDFYLRQGGATPVWVEGVRKAGDTVTGMLSWANPPPNGHAIDITAGSIQIHGGGVRVEAPGEIQAPLFVAVGDPAGYAFGTPAQQNGGIYKKLQEGIVIRQDADDHRPAIEPSDGSDLWEIMDARGGSIRRQGTNRGLNFLDDDEAENYASIYQDGAGNFVLRKGNPGFAAATCVRTRPGDPARLEIVGEPERDLDAVNKAYVDAAIDSGPFVKKAGDDVSGTLRWTDPPGAGEAINITRGLLALNESDLRSTGRIAANLFDCWQDGGGYFFQRSISGEIEGGLYKRVDDGLVLLQSSGDQRPQIELSDRSERWTILDQRGGQLDGDLLLHKDGTGGGTAPLVAWYDDAGALAAIYGSRYTSDGTPHIVFRVEGEAGAATMMRSRFADPPRLELLGDPEEPLDATNKVYVDQAIAGVSGFADDRILRAGDTMEGPLRSPIAPVDDQDLVNKVYVDEVIDDVRAYTDDRILRSGDTMEGPLRSPIAPVDDQDLANKAYVDRMATAAPTVIGAIDASTGQCRLLVGPGPVPDPGAVPPGSYLICDVAGTIPSGAAAGTTMSVGDWLINDGAFWHPLAVGSAGAATTADQVALIPPVLGANVQQAIEAVDAQLDAIDIQLDARLLKAGDAMTGPLTLAGPPTADSHATTRAYVDSHLVKTWATGAAYAVNDFVRYDNLLFEVVTPIPIAPAVPDFTTIAWLAGSQSDYWAGTRDNTNALWIVGNWVHIATIPAYGSFRLQLECFGTSIDCSFVFEIGTTFGAGTFTIITQTKNPSGTLWRQFRLSAQGGGANLVRFEGQLGSATVSNFKIAITGLRVDQGPAAQRLSLVKPLVASATNLGGTQYLLMAAYGNGSVQAPRFDVFETGGRFHCHHPEASDANDGDIGARIFGRGLNIVGCRTEAGDPVGNVSRAIQLYGEVSINGTYPFIAREFRCRDDNFGLQTFAGGWFYKRSGGGLCLRCSNGNQQPEIENNDGSNRRAIVDTARGAQQNFTWAPADWNNLSTGSYWLILSGAMAHFHFDGRTARNFPARNRVVVATLAVGHRPPRRLSLWARGGPAAIVCFVEVNTDGVIAIIPHEQLNSNTAVELSAEFALQ